MKDEEIIRVLMAWEDENSFFFYIKLRGLHCRLDTHDRRSYRDTFKIREGQVTER